MHGICFSFEERIRCAKAARPHAGHADPICILAARLHARGRVSFWRRMHGLLLRRSQEGLCQARKTTSVHFGRAPEGTGAAFTIFCREDAPSVILASTIYSQRCIFRGCLNAWALPRIFQAVSPLQSWANRVFLLSGNVAGDFAAV